MSKPAIYDYYELSVFANSPVDSSAKCPSPYKASRVKRLDCKRNIVDTSASCGGWRSTDKGPILQQQF